jgi:isopenicillin N synthase-like dioxygenase
MHGNIPVVDFSAYRAASPDRVPELATELAEVCQRFGFFYVENTGIPEDLLRTTERQVYDFFNLPEDQKNKIHISKSPYHRGYFPFSEENALGSEIKDQKEGFDMALELPVDDPDVVAGKPFHGPNTWPDSPPEFRPSLRALFDEFRGVCAGLSSLFAVALGEAPDFFVDKTDKPMCQMRVVKYPPQENPRTAEAIGCGAHTDYGIVSMIWQMDVPGLEIQTSGGEWIEAPRIPGTFVCPIGDMTQRWTNDHWKATVHQVISNTTESRHATAFFFDPNYDSVVEPLPKFVTADRPARYEPTTMGAHVTRGFDGTFAYRADAVKA